MLYPLLKPDPIKIQKILNELTRSGARPTYTLGLDHAQAPKGFVLDEYRLLLGRDCFDTARRQLRQWKMFEVGWIQLCWEDAPVAPNVTVASLIYLGIGWALCPVRIVRIIDEPLRFGFAMVTLPGHEECGEEQFLVHQTVTGEVYMEIRAISKPATFLASLGKPLVRYLQKKFAADAMDAVLDGVRQFHR